MSCIYNHSSAKPPPPPRHRRRRRATTRGRAHHPLRPQLTRVLQDSIGGNSKTSLVIAASTATYNRAETLSTLGFGARAKRVKNRATQNVALSLDEYRRQLLAERASHAELRSCVLNCIAVHYKYIYIYIYTETYHYPSHAKLRACT